MYKKDRTKETFGEDTRAWNKLDYLDPECELYATGIKFLWDTVTESIENNDADAREAKQIRWNIIHRLCLAECCKALRGVGLTTDAIRELSLDCAIHAFDRMDSPKHGGKMTYKSIQAWCYYSTLEVLKNKQKIFEDKIVLLEDYNGEET